IRGAYNLISSLEKEKREKGIVCASAGNHAQGVALSCSTLKTKGVIYMPEQTPKQKVSKVRYFGGEFVEIRLIGRTFDECSSEAVNFCEENKMTYVPPFDDYKVMAGQGTVALEILEDLDDVDTCVVPIGGGGLVAGLSTYFKEVSPSTTIVGVEPNGAPAMERSLKEGEVIELSEIDTFVDGAAVKKVGRLTFATAKDLIDQMVLTPEGQVCSEMIEFYQKDGIVTEPAGALSASALYWIRDKIKGKKVVSVVSGGNKEKTRNPEIIEKSLIYQGLKHYFLVEFLQKPGELRNFLDNILGPNDDITLFEYVKKTIY
ncbi:threonine dehydratase, partial [bacterium M21]